MLIFRLGDGNKQKGYFNLNLINQCGFEASMIVVTNLEQFVPVKDKDGNIWFGGRYGLLWRYDGNQLKDLNLNCWIKIRSSNTIA